MSRNSQRLIDTDSYSAHLRGKAIDLEGRRLLVTNFHRTEQEKDLTEPPNCEGFGRVRHFRRATSPWWVANPLPIDPACKALNLPRADLLRAQVFQNSACNWRCWYCFVPFNLLSANPKHADWVSPARLVEMYLELDDPPAMIDLTGGQPDLVPEWVPWMMRELQTRNLSERVYLWSDDNLSNDYFWRHLSEADRELVATYTNYGRVCCFKGFNAESFSFNTLADPALFGRQFHIMRKFLATGIDVYAYATFTTPTPAGISDDMRRFLDQLQSLDERLPLRTVPLEVQIFTPVKQRLDDEKNFAIKNQWIAIEAWLKEIECRFTGDERAKNIADVRLRSRNIL